MYTPRSPYMESANSSRPCFEFKYSFLIAVSAYQSLLQILPIPLPNHANGDHRNSPLNRPLHRRIRGNKRRNRKQDLVSRPPQDVPEAVTDERGHGALSVRAKNVRHDAFARPAAAFVWVAPGADVPSVRPLSACVSSAMYVVCMRRCGRTRVEGDCRCWERGRT
jgi:hypothetical protein